MPPADLDLRLVHYFTVVAEHRHFGRAAEALHITQPALSRQIRRLEEEVGTRLLDRAPQGTQFPDPAWNAFWRIDPRPDGSRAPDGPFVAALEDKLELIAAGQAVAIIPAVAAGGLRPDLTTVPLEGVEPSQVVLVTRPGDRGPLLLAFRRSAQTHLTGPARPVSTAPIRPAQ